ncbi:MAG UNVERIFIED_CONTAM: YqgE/AlgH family protein [Planctomycetaceae bacterium]
MFVGGPVRPTSLFILHRIARLAASDREVSPGIFLAGSEHSLRLSSGLPCRNPASSDFV